MPVSYSPTKRKWRIGKGKAMYKTKASATRAYRAYLAKKKSGRKGRHRNR